MSPGKAASLMLLALTAACSNPTGILEEFFEQNLAQWELSRPDSYEFHLTRSCVGCVPTEPVLIVVENRVVVSRSLSSTGEPLDPQLNAGYPDIPGLFDLVRDSFRRRVAFSNIEYNSTWGFPAVIAIDYDASRSDDNIVYVVENFTPAEP